MHRYIALPRRTATITTATTANTIGCVALAALAASAVIFGIRFLSQTHTSLQTKTLPLYTVQSTPRSDRAPAHTSTVNGLPEHRDYPLVNGESGDIATYETFELAVRPLHRAFLCQEEAAPVTMRIGSTTNLEQAETVQLIKTLGYGGSKRAIQLNNGQALITPNGTGAPSWANIVHHETTVSALHRRLDLYSPLNTRVYVFPDVSSDKCIPTYTNPSFADLAKNGVYVLDRKRSAYPSHPELRLFKEHKDMLNMDLWRPLMGEMIQDLAKLVFYQIPQSFDSFNLAVVRDHTGYRIRYYGFDFSWNKAPPVVILPIPENFTRLRGPEKEVMKLISRLLIDTAEAVSLEHSIKTHNDQWDQLKEFFLKTFAEEVFQAALALQR